MARGTVARLALCAALLITQPEQAEAANVGRHGKRVDVHPPPVALHKHGGDGSRFVCGDGDNAAAEGRDFKVRGANVGGWLVLEPWITPSLFYQFLDASAKFGNAAPDKVGMDTYSFCRALGPEEGNRQLRRHWKAWLTEDDVRAIAGTGADTVRLPVGDWMYTPYGPYVGCTDGALAEVDRFLDFCEKYGLRVLIDIHGVKGSQNGFDNSGQSMGLKWTSIAQIVPIATSTFMHWPIREANWIGEWDRLHSNYSSISHANLQHTLGVIEKIVDRYQRRSSFWGLEPVNEPWEFTPLAPLQRFYWDAYQVVRRKAPHLYFIMHDAFRLAPQFWDGFMAGCPRIAIDTHIYQAWNDPGPPGRFVENACGMAAAVGAVEALGVPVITGEWSLATDNCAMWLNGFQDNLPGFPKVFCRYVDCPAPYTGADQPGAPPDRATGPRDPFGSGYSMPMYGKCPTGQPWEERGYSEDEVMAAIARAKLHVFEGTGHGWLFWNFKTEIEDRWDFLRAHRRGWLPARIDAIGANEHVANACPAAPRPATAGRAGAPAPPAARGPPATALLLAGGAAAAAALLGVLRRRRSADRGFAPLP